MVSFGAICLVLILTVSLKILLNFIKATRSYLKCSLKGPSGVPILGNVFPLLRNYKAPMKQYTDWAKSFGGIYKIRVGSQVAIVLSDLKLFNKAFISQGPKFHFRPRGTVLSVILGNKGIVTSDGNVWHQHRKFLLRKLQQLQVGKQNKHEMVFAETEKLVYKIKSGLLRSEKHRDINHSDGDDYDPLTDIGVSIFNTMWNFIGSENVAKGEDERIRKFLYESSGEMQVAEMGGVWNYALILQLIWIFWNNPVKLLISTIRKSFFISKEINSKNSETGSRTEKSNHQNNETENLTSLYLQEMGNPDTEFTTFSGSQLRATLRDLIAAGVDTTFTTIRWILLLLAKNQDCLIKLQNELDVALTKKTLFELSSYAARYDLPYLEAVTIETLRYRPTIHTICHTIQEDIILTDDSSYSTQNQSQTHTFIPRDTWVIGNIWGIHHDENVWKNPEIFNPERFIESNGKINKELANKCIPFSSGVRKCAGELMARVELYSFLVTLLSNFDVKLDAESLRTTTLEEPIVGVSLMPPKHKLVFTSRR